MKTKIDLKNYEVIDKLDKDEQMIWDSMQSGNYISVATDELKIHYSDIFTNNNKRNQPSTIRLTSSDKLLAKSRAREEGMPYQVLLASIIHKWLHGKLKEA
jgi:predicted DNA binding CopG/RHH family protein